MSARFAGSGRLLATAAASLLLSTSHATEVVRMHFSTGASLDAQNPQPYDAFTGLGVAAYFDLELYERETPLTVANFLNYVDDGAGNNRYNGTFVHRLVPTADLSTDGLAIMQGGGFVFDPLVGPFSDPFVSGVSHIAEDPPIVNEPGLSNVRGTIAMAKLADPDSATSEWFINLTDNSTVLDDAANSGGFTVFGQVLGSGMTQVVDLLDRQSPSDTDYMPTFVFGLPPFADLPLVDFPPGPVQPEQLLLVPLVERVLSVDTSDLDTNFSLVQTGASATGVVSVVNRRSDPLVMDGVTLVSPGAQPFIVVADACASGVTLQSGESCDVSLDYSPVTAQPASASLDINFQNTDLNAVSVGISGNGAALDPVLDVPTSVDFGRAVAGAAASRQVVIQNLGGEAGEFLTVGSIVSAGGPQSGFTLSGLSACQGVQLFFGDSCSFTVTLDTGVAGDKTDTLTVAHSAGADAVIALSATVLVDSDLQVDSTLDFGQVTANAVTTRQFLLQNTGPQELALSGFVFSSGYSIDTTRGCGSLSSVPAQSGCFLILQVNAPGVGQTLDGTMTIQYDSSNPAVLDVQLTALAMGDGDGVSDAIEDAGPNGGDGNADGTLDSEQEHVSSFVDANGTYVTLATDPGLRLINVAAVPNPSPATTPTASGASLVFEYGFFDFIVDGLTPGGSTTVTVSLPPGTSADAWFMYGFTVNATQERWYQFTYNGTVGAEIQGNQVILHFVDGQDGDNDLSANGQIVDPGGPARLISGSSGGGGGCAMLSRSAPGARPVAADLMVLLVLSLLLGRRVKPRYVSGSRAGRSAY